MNEHLLTILSMTLYKLGTLLVGVAFAHFGYRLLVHGVFDKTSEISAKWDNIQLVVKKAAPGTLFSLFGTAIICFTIFSGFHYKTYGIDAEHESNPRNPTAPSGERVYLAQLGDEPGSPVRYVELRGAGEGLPDDAPGHDGNPPAPGTPPGERIYVAMRGDDAAPPVRYVELHGAREGLPGGMHRHGSPPMSEADRQHLEGQARANIAGLNAIVPALRSDLEPEARDSILAYIEMRKVDEIMSIWSTEWGTKDEFKEWVHSKGAKAVPPSQKVPVAIFKAGE